MPLTAELRSLLREALPDMPARRRGARCGYGRGWSRAPSRSRLPPPNPTRESRPTPPWLSPRRVASSDGGVRRRARDQLRACSGRLVVGREPQRWTTPSKAAPRRLRLRDRWRGGLAPVRHQPRAGAGAAHAACDCAACRLETHAPPWAPAPSCVEQFGPAARAAATARVTSRPRRAPSRKRGRQLLSGVLLSSVAVEWLAVLAQCFKYTETLWLAVWRPLARA
jgi:hypothetical protein